MDPTTRATRCVKALAKIFSISSPLNWLNSLCWPQGGPCKRLLKSSTSSTVTTGYHRTIRARYQDIYIPAGIARIYLPTITVTSSLTQINAVRTKSWQFSVGSSVQITSASCTWKTMSLAFTAHHGSRCWYRLFAPVPCDCTSFFTYTLQASCGL